MLKIVICDDEPVFCEYLKNKITAYGSGLSETCRILCYTSANDLLAAPLDFHILLLDIQMPHMDGIRLAGRLREQGFTFSLIFITALEQYVFDAFELEAVDYICKPVDENRLKRALDRSRKALSLKNGKTLLIQTMNWCKTVKLDTIYYCEVINRKIYLHTSGGIIDYYSKIQELEKRLDERFFRCHRSYLVNLDYMAAYCDGQIHLEHGEQIPVSRLRHNDFMKAMMTYMKEKEGV